MFCFLALLVFSVSWEYSRAQTMALSSKESVACSDHFFLKPGDTDRETFLDQFKPCGWYLTHCQDKFGDWFRNDGGFKKSDDKFFIKSNVCYPGSGEDDLFDGIHLVQFDIGLDKTHYDAYEGLKYEPGNKNPLIDDIERDSDKKRKYLTFPKNQAGEYFQMRSMTFGETCIETFAKTGDHWGGNYGCMGKCGPGCKTGILTGQAKDCMKHDVCSYFKTSALGKQADGFCQDFDCGDEAAQTVINCRNNTWWSNPVICDKDSYVDIHRAARAQDQKRACTLRSKWDRHQGMPWLRREDGKSCDTYDDCQSRRCDSNWRFKRVCMQRLDNGKRCSEDSDCKSLYCRRPSDKLWDRRPPICKPSSSWP